MKRFRAAAIMRRMPVTPMAMFTSQQWGSPVLLVAMHASPGDAPPPLTGWRFLTEWELSWGAGVPLFVAIALYLWGVRRLHRRGDRWPVGRSIAYHAGMVLLVVSLMSALGAYDTVLFSVHMVQHMLITMVAPVFIAQGAPVTLALRVLPPAPRRALLVVLHSWVARVLLFPPLTTLVMVGTPFALYLTPLYEYTLRNDWAHDGLHIWMVGMGLAFFVPLLGVDPAPHQLPYPLRVGLFFLTMPFHAFLGTAIMGASRLIAEDWYVAFGRTWGPSPLDDQVMAGGIMWATGDFTMLSAMTAIVIQWVKASQREARRIDRELDRQEEAQARRAAQGPAGRSRYDDPIEATPHHIEDDQ